MSLRAEPQAKFDPAAISVLVVDDHPYMRAIVLDILRTSGAGHLISAASGQDALEEIAAHHPSVIITDWNMEGMNGLQLVRAVRSGPEATRDAPIIMMSSDAQRRQIEIARLAGIDEFIAKPLSAYKVISRLREVCCRARPFIESPVYSGPCRRRRKTPYHGPLRRMSDPMENFAPGADLQQEQRRVVAACVERVHEMALDLDQGDRLQIRAIYNSANEANAVAMESRDYHLARATKSLLRYLQGMGATDKLQADVVQTHLDAIHKVIVLPSRLINEREALVVGLELVVSKKLRPPEAA